MKFSAPHWGWTSGRATPSLRPTPMRQRQQTRQDATYRSRKSVQTTGASSLGSVGQRAGVGIGDRSSIRHIDEAQVVVPARLSILEDGFRARRKIDVGRGG